MDTAASKADVERFLLEAEEALERMSARLEDIEDQLDERTVRELSGLIYGLGILQLFWGLRYDPETFLPSVKAFELPDWMYEDDNWDSVDGEPVWVPSLS